MQDSVVRGVAGTCQAMCPENEMRMRQTNNLVHYFEKTHGTKLRGRCAQETLCMVKTYSRPAAGRVDPKPSELRPANVLLKTIDYLFGRIVPRTEVPWCRVYDFVFDRLRAIRQDMVIQCIVSTDAVRILEMNVRFLIYANYRLCGESMDDFDPEINNSHIQECLKRLLVLYDEHPEACCCNREEFASLYVVYNLCSSEALLFAFQQKENLRASKIFNTAVELGRARLVGNVLRVLRLASDLPALHLCAFHKHMKQIQCHAIHVICTAVGNRPQSFDLTLLSKWLRCDLIETIALCSACGFVPADSSVSLSKAKYQEPNDMLSQKCCQIDRKLASASTSISDLLSGLQCQRLCQQKCATNAES